MYAMENQTHNCSRLQKLGAMESHNNSTRSQKRRRGTAILSTCCVAAVATIGTVICFDVAGVGPAAPWPLRRLTHAIKDAITEEDTPPYIHPDEHTLVANMGRYPGYVGNTNVDGWVTVTFHQTSLTLEAKVTGVEPEVTAGVHIHEGMTCCATTHVDPANPNAPRDSVGDHYYNKVTRLVDNWDEEHGATYTSLADGTTDPKLVSSGAFHLGQGYTHVENVGHVVVVHDSNGVRIGCGVLRNPEELNDFEKNRFINGIEACSEEGKEDGIIARDEEEGNQR